MRYDEAITQVRRMAGDVNVNQFTNDDVLAWLNSAVRECAVLNNLLQVTASSTTIAGTTSYPVPVDILKLHSVKYNDHKLRVLTLQEFDEQYPKVDLTLRAQPSVAYVWAGQVILYPAPDAAKSLKMDYIKDPPEVLIANIGTTNIPLPVGYQRRLLDYCLAMVAQQDDDMNRYQTKMQEFISGVQILKDQPEYTQDLYPSISVSTDDMDDFYGFVSW